MSFLKDDIRGLKISEDVAELFIQIGVYDRQTLFDFAMMFAIYIIQMIKPDMDDDHAENIKSICVFYKHIVEIYWIFSF